MIKRLTISRPIDVRLFKTGSSYVPMTQIRDFFDGYDWATIQVWWSDFDAYTGSITMTERVSSNVPEWASCNVPNQSVGIEDQDGSGRGTHIFRDVDLHAGEIFLHINRNTATTGSVWYEVLARKQYADWDFVQKEVAEIRKGVRDLVAAIKDIGARR